MTLVLIMVMGFAGCAKKEEVPPEAEGRTVIYFAPSYVTAQVRDAYKELVTVYNENQGVKDGIYVQMRENSSALANLQSALRSNYQYDVIQLREDEYKTLAMQGNNFFVALDQYMTEDAKAAMQWNDIPAGLINSFRMNTTPSEGGKFLAGEGASLLALPNGSNPQMLFYNKRILEQGGINLISVPESELAAYNAANNATLVPHGYAEYKEPPFATAKSSRNEAGEYVYKVFNECIPMSWEEQRLIARAFQKQHGYEYGFMSEWWFYMAFSVGGDCVGWDEASGQYKLTLGDKQPGYLALEDITVNGIAYAKGDVLNYESKTYLNSNASELNALKGKVYALPSMYDTILEFTRMGVPATKQAETGINGYGLAPTSTENRAQRFTSGTDCPFLIEEFHQAQSFYNVLKDALGMAVPAQYREYVGGSTYQKNGKEYLKVVGETYDGQVYTGQLHVENGTPIVGEATTAIEANGLFLPANTKNKNYDEAFKFASWVAGPEGQAILSKGNMTVPNQSTYGMNEYAKSEDRLIPNMWSGAYVAQKADIGDYSYFTSLTWITEWSETFNSVVREGDMTLSAFLADKQDDADMGLKGMRLRINGR
jgi:ABC-type glycerol-3-phosphate transport system substrate-binding protein